MRRIASSLGLALVLAAGATGCPGEPDPPVVVDNCEGVTAGSICTWAGTSEVGLGEAGTHRSAAALYNPIEIEFGPDGTPYILDWNNHRIISIVDNLVELVMGAPIPGDGPEDRSDLVEPGAPGDTVGLNHPTDLAFDPISGRAFSTNWHNHKIRRYDPADGNVFVLCGRGPGFAGDGGPVGMSRLRFPHSVAFSDAGDLYFVDAGNDRIRVIDTNGDINTFAGDGMQGFVDGVDRATARFSFPLGTLMDAEPGGAITFGPDGNLYVADFQNHRIRMIDMASGMVTTVAGSYTPPMDVTMLPPAAGGFSGDGGPAIDAELNFPRDIAFGPNGNLYISDTMNDRIRMVDMATGDISTVAGNGTRGFGGDRGPATEASLDRPAGIGFGPDGNLYIADMWNHRVRMVDL